MQPPDGLKIIDCHIVIHRPGWVYNNVQQQLRDPESLSGGSKYITHLFRDAGSRIDKGDTAESIIERMDEVGIAKGILLLHAEKEINQAEEFRALEKYPDRLFAAVVVNPLQGMKATRELEYFAKNYPTKAVRQSAVYFQQPYNANVYYPIYSKAIELNLPVMVSVGFAGPRIRGQCQDPTYLDEVLWFFPELKIIMSHGGAPWASTCVSLLIKWPNCFFLTSAVAPRHLSPELIHFFNTRGKDKVLFGSGYPLIPMTRAVEEARSLDIRDEVFPMWFSGNACRIFDMTV